MHLNVGRRQKIPPMACPQCLSRFSTVSSIGAEAKPTPGAFTICVKCGCVMAFMKGLKLRRLTPDEARAAAKNKTLIEILVAFKKNGGT